MVKFGVQLTANRVKEWQDEYIAYERLKKLIKSSVSALAVPSDSRTTNAPGPRQRALANGTLANRASHSRPSTSPTERTSLLTPTIARASRRAGFLPTPSQVDCVGLVPSRVVGESEGVSVDVTPRARDGHNETEFERALKQEVAKVDAFFMRKLYEYEARLEYLQRSATAHTARSNVADASATTPAPPGGAGAAERASPRPSHEHKRVASAARTGLRARRRVISDGGSSHDTDDDGGGDDDNDDDEGQESGSEAGSRSAQSLKRAAIYLYRHVRMLENYQMLNYTGIVKILKKFDKNVCKGFGAAAATREGAQSLEMTPITGARVTKDRVLSWVSGMAWRNSASRLAALVAGVESLYAGAFCGGNAQTARIELLAKQHEQPTSWVDLETGLRCGAVCVLIVWALWDCLVDSAIQNVSATRQFSAAVPVYRAAGCLILLVWCWGLDVYVWTRARVNYLFIFDCDHRNTLGHREVWNEASLLSIVFLINFLLFFKTVRGQVFDVLPAWLYPLLLVLFLAWRAVFPWDRRRDLWGTVANVMAAPFGRCLFRDTYAGDVMTSLVKVFSDLAYTACFLGTGEFLKLAPGADVTVSAARCTSAPAYALVASPIVHAAPLWFRFLQNVRRFRDTGHRFPHLANAVKYAFAQTVSLYGVFHPNYTGTGASLTAYKVAWVVIYMSSTLYTYSWDVTMDWSLLRCSCHGNTEHPGLRARMMYRRKWTYYLAIVADFLLRFLWTFSLIPTSQLPPAIASRLEYTVLPFVAAAEICRRTMWGFFRVENEHLNNVADFRRVDFVPLHFETAVGAGPRKPDGRRGKRAAQVEAALFVLVVVGVGVLAAVRHW